MTSAQMVGIGVLIGHTADGNKAKTPMPYGTGVLLHEKPGSDLLWHA
jgi:hypothetical protein